MVGVMFFDISSAFSDDTAIVGYVTLSVLPLIKKARGRVVNVASVFGRISPFGGPYCVSKYGVEAFNDSLRIDMAPFGIKVACIEPGFFATNMTDAASMMNNLRKLWDRLPQDVKDDYGHSFLEDITVFPGPWMRGVFSQKIDLRKQQV
uniref:retinol dehydrogenase 7-like n=1 Tax=Monopterus albus TaxID=43700 RepID=UPI0009B32233|nr:retinol dehydrogenase 7-like [Monopterus albus]